MVPATGLEPVNSGGSNLAKIALKGRLDGAYTISVFAPETRGIAAFFKEKCTAEYCLKCHEPPCLQG